MSELRPVDPAFPLVVDLRYGKPENLPTGWESCDAPRLDIEPVIESVRQWLTWTIAVMESLERWERDEPEPMQDAGGAAVRDAYRAVELLKRCDHRISCHREKTHYTADEAVCELIKLRDALGATAKHRTSNDREMKETQAIAWLLKVGPNASEIARQIGVPRTTLMGWPEFSKRYRQVAADREVRRKNYRHADVWEDRRPDE